jgi:hypothetical protein
MAHRDVRHRRRMDAARSASAIANHDDLVRRLVAIRSPARSRPRVRARLVRSRRDARHARTHIELGIRLLRLAARCYSVPARAGPIGAGAPRVSGGKGVRAMDP